MGWLGKEPCLRCARQRYFDHRRALDHSTRYTWIGRTCLTLRATPFWLHRIRVRITTTCRESFVGSVRWGHWMEHRSDPVCHRCSSQRDVRICHNLDDRSTGHPFHSWYLLGKSKQWAVGRHFLALRPDFTRDRIFQVQRVAVFTYRQGSGD